MKKITLSLGILMIFVGLMGVLFTLKGNMIGFSINEFLNQSEGKPLQLSEINEVIIRGSSKKTLSLTAKNMGETFLNNCKITSESNWIKPATTKGLSPGEKAEIIFSIKIPENTKEGEYDEKISLKCEEESASQNIKIIVQKSLDTITIRDIEQQRDKLAITYVFDNSNFIGDDIGIEIWLTNEQGEEIARKIDSFSINKDDLIERSFTLEIPGNSKGIHDIYFALANDPEVYTQQSIVLGQSKTTGNAIFETSKSKLIFYVIFLIFIGAGIFMIIRSRSKKIHETRETLGKNPYENLRGASG